jgi:DNA-directed RNA polymerase specialized sigma24 family protein
VTEDLLQQSLMKAVERGNELKKSDSAVSWFYRILRNAVTDITGCTPPTVERWRASVRQ